MVQASAARGKAWGAQARAACGLPTSSVDSPGGPPATSLLKGGLGVVGAAPSKAGCLLFLDAFRLKPSLLHMPSKLIEEDWGRRLWVHAQFCTSSFPRACSLSPFGAFSLCAPLILCPPSLLPNLLFVWVIERPCTTT